MNTKFSNTDKKLIQEFLDVGFWKLSQEKQNRWRCMMALSDEFIKEYSRELDLRNGIEKAIKENNVIELREQIIKITNKKNIFKRLFEWINELLTKII